MRTVVHENENNKKPLGRFLLLVASVGFGSAGVYFANEYIRSEVDGYRRQFEKTEPMVDVVVPSQNLLRGDTVSEAAMSVRKIPAADSFDIAMGQKLDFDIDEGAALLWAHLDGGLSPTFSGRVPDGQRALTVRVHPWKW